MIDVGNAQVEDLDGIVDLFDEIDEYYGDPPHPDQAQRADEVRRILFNGPSLVHAIVGRDGNRVIALAAYSFLWPAAGTSISLFLKELFVTQTHRRKGVGQLLMRELGHIATARSCSRIEWTTERTNSAAMRFYSKLGAPAQPEKVFFRVQGAELAKLASGDPPMASGES